MWGRSCSASADHTLWRETLFPPFAVGQHRLQRSERQTDIDKAGGQRRETEAHGIGRAHVADDTAGDQRGHQATGFRVANDDVGTVANSGWRVHCDAGQRRGAGGKEVDELARL